MSLESTIEKLVDSKIEKAMQGGPQTVLAEYKGTDSQGKGWVVIAGSTESTPITRATVEAAPGDTVSVTIGDGKCVMDANISNPSAGVAGVRKVAKTAEQAADDAEKAIMYSQQASTAASSAQASAQSAANAAGDAQATANAVHGMAEQAQTDAATAKAAADAATEMLDGMQEAAEAAGTTLEGIYQDAKDAETAAESAQSSASAATRSLSDVERVVGTLNWIAEHGEYVNQAGQTFDSSKVYYTRSGSGTSADPYVYTVVANPVAADIASYYLLRVDESVQNYLASHLWMDDFGLNLAVDSASGYRIHQGTVDGTHALGVYIINPSDTVVGEFSNVSQFYDSFGNTVASLGESGAIIGREASYHTSLTPKGVEVKLGSDRLMSATHDGTNASIYVGASDGVAACDKYVKVWYSYYSEEVGVTLDANVFYGYYSSTATAPAPVYQQGTDQQIATYSHENGEDYHWKELRNNIGELLYGCYSGLFTDSIADQYEAICRQLDLNGYSYSGIDDFVVFDYSGYDMLNYWYDESKNPIRDNDDLCISGGTLLTPQTEIPRSGFELNSSAAATTLEVGSGALDFIDTDLQFNGERVYHIVKRNGWSESSDESTLPVTPCFVLDTSDGGLYWCDGS